MNLTWQESSDIESSIIDFLRTTINSFNVTILDANGVPKPINVYAGKIVSDSWKMPLIQVYIDHKLTTRLEIGSNIRERDYYIILDIRTELSGQEINIADWLEKILNDGVPYYKYHINSLNINNPIKCLYGHLDFDFFTSNSVPTFDDADIFDQNRYRIMLKVWEH